jgi:hypothetical protein
MNGGSDDEVDLAADEEEEEEVFDNFLLNAFGRLLSM